LDVCVEIPQQGIIRSLNVHVSGAIMLWEYTRQHMTAHHQQVNSHWSMRRVVESLQIICCIAQLMLLLLLLLMMLMMLMLMMMLVMMGTSDLYCELVLKKDTAQQAAIPLKTKTQENKNI
jgi:hypothetical protein